MDHGVRCFVSIVSLVYSMALNSLETDAHQVSDAVKIITFFYQILGKFAMRYSYCMTVATP